MPRRCFDEERWFRSDVTATEDPFISPDVTVPELTVRVLGVGIVLGVLMTAANAYLGLYAGMTVSASIPAAVMSMIILRLMFNDVTILENNSVQTMASAGESLAAGVIFTVPAFLVVGLWTDINWGITLAIALLGGWLGTMFTIALRRLFIVEEALPYPEGVACREVLVAGEEGGDGMVAILYALGIGALYGFVVKVMAAVHHAVEGAVEFLGTRLYAGADLSVALFSVGFIVGLRIASFIFLGGVIGFGILTPIYGFVHGWPEGDLAAGFTSIFLSQIRYIGVGAMVVGGVHTLWTMRKTIIDGLSGAFKATDGEAERLLRTEQDIPLRYVAMVVAGLVVLTFLFYWSTTGSLVLALAGALFLALVAFFFSAVAGYIAGVVGSSNSPVSGMTIATMLFTVLLVWVVGDLILNLATEELILATLLIAAVVASSSAIAGDVMQDLKTGNMVGATPWRQQTAEVVGVTVGALVIGPVLSLLHNAFRISATACLDNPLPSDPTCSRALFAPQAELIGAIAEGAFGGSINIQMVMLGVLFAIALIRLKMPVMSVAIGLYLPLKLSVPIMLGGIIAATMGAVIVKRIDGETSEAPSEEATKTVDAMQARGVLIGAGYIAGESLLGVLLAVLIVLDVDLSAMFGITALGDLPSLLFFFWFVAVFVALVAQTMPKGITPMLVVGVMTNAIRRAIGRLIPKALQAAEP
ncbi:MAG: oligopeptide transporter, OPT family [Euryarchaeota archaeon]|nr:oligopeptide transporter, OPT family [Euryarchaeota archaeon]